MIPKNCPDDVVYALEYLQSIPRDVPVLIGIDLNQTGGLELYASTKCHGNYSVRCTTISEVTDAYHMLELGLRFALFQRIMRGQIDIPYKH